MGIFERYNNLIERQDWDHLRFLLGLLLVLVISVLMFYVWVLVLTTNEILPLEYLQVAIREMTTGYLAGGISGLVLGFFVLLPKYIGKNWDLHEVVPLFLFIDLILIILLQILLTIFTQSTLLRVSTSIGFVIGSLLTIIVYAGEVKKEHTSIPQEENQ